MKKNKLYKMRKALISVAVIALSASLVLTGCGTEAQESSENKPGTNSSSDSIKVGILHSLSGTMAISEVSVKDAEMMAIEEINAAGGVLGKKIEPVIEDGASDWPKFAEKAKKLLQSDKVATVFGCWTSASRKAVLPVFEENNGLLWYPVQYEGMESSPNIFYTGAAPNQQIVPAVEWLLQNKGKKFFLLGSDYVFPRTANKIIKAQLSSMGGELIAEEYTPLGHTDYSTIVNKIKSAKPDVVFNTLNGDSNVAFFKQLKDAGISSKDLTTCSVSVAEEEVRGIGAENMKGHLVSWNYYQTTDTPENAEFVKKYKAKYGDKRVTDDPIEAAYIAVYLWAEAVKKAGSTEVEKVKEAAKGLEFKAPEGTVKIEGENQHIWKPVRIGEVQEDGLIKEVWSTGKTVRPDPYLKTYDWAKGLSN
ncbi:urea ABC transporter substrate-binding protein [Pseudobacteroides cellulosolvens]|uniref:Urea ABC transporter, urea binding protein n=1 Tax=Pseudobacteroides cellulosolvens ATCC 35603 = DSM 2933 TaxID=398512 RepID=A0A0L6JVB0_9FIRM|nr:urea ABC transporter substrate-binding protein [Pseudobacteroides cellulosolvens]KNY29786.1 urea ABC transporter, urea binding protein [Pseudobacteroides cellulosolvens ATCC 35603 = DSM 2933]